MCLTARTSRFLSRNPPSSPPTASGFFPPWPGKSRAPPISTVELEGHTESGNAPVSAGLWRLGNLGGPGHGGAAQIAGERRAGAAGHQGGRLRRHRAHAGTRYFRRDQPAGDGAVEPARRRQKSLNETSIHVRHFCSHGSRGHLCRGQWISPRCRLKPGAVRQRQDGPAARATRRRPWRASGPGARNARRPK